MLDSSYKILECSNTDTIEDVKKKYRILALKYHPDRYKGSSEKFIKINNAYNNIISTELKKNNICDTARQYLFYIYLMVKPKNIFLNIEVCMEDIYKGRIKKVNYKQYINKKQTNNTVYIDLHNFQKTYVFDDFGDENPVTKNKGDLYITCNVISNDSNIKLKKISHSYDIIHSITINLYEYIYGLNDKYHLFGEKIDLIDHIPNIHGLTKEFKNRGLPFYDINDHIKRGSLIIEMKLTLQDSIMSNKLRENNEIRKMINDNFNI